MNVRLLAGLAGVAATALAFTATAHPASRCFFVRDVGDTTVGGPNTLYFAVKDRAHMHAVAYFHIETKVHCSVGNPNGVHRGGFGIGSVNSTAWDAQICKADDLQIILKPANDGGGYCPIATIERMLPKEVAALPSSIRP